MFIDNCGHSTASGFDVMAGVGGGAGVGSGRCQRAKAGAGSGRRKQPEQTKQQTDWKGRREATFLFVRSPSQNIHAEVGDIYPKDCAVCDHF